MWPRDRKQANAVGKMKPTNLLNLELPQILPQICKSAASVKCSRVKGKTGLPVYLESVVSRPPLAKEPCHPFQPGDPMYVKLLEENAYYHLAGKDLSSTADHLHYHQNKRDPAEFTGNTPNQTQVSSPRILGSPSLQMMTATRRFPEPINWFLKQTVPRGRQHFPRSRILKRLKRPPDESCCRQDLLMDANTGQKFEKK